MTAYYNEFDPYAAQWIRNLIAARLIPAGDVDERSITEVEASDLSAYSQCHFFAGIAGWALAARLAGWPDDRELWTGSPPCQPFSVAGKQRGQDDERHLWPHYFRLISARRPAVAMGEQVAAAVGKAWLDGVLADLEGIGYTGRAVVVPACAVDAPHRRDRLWFVAHAAGEGRGQVGLPPTGHLPANDNRPGDWAGDAGEAGNSQRLVADTDCERRQRRQGAEGRHVPYWPHAGRIESNGGLAGRSEDRSFWGNHAWIIGHDGKARRVVADVRRVVDGLPEGLDGLCADFYAEAAEGVIAHAAATKRDPGEVLRTLRDRVASEAVRETPRGFHGVRESEILLPYLRELERRIDDGRAPGQVEEIARAGVRGVRLYAPAACAPQGWEPSEQRAGEYPDPVHALPQLLARASRQALEALLRDAPIVPLLEHGATARVGKLRALGNAIVPTLAAEVIAAYLDCRP